MAGALVVLAGSLAIGDLCCRSVRGVGFWELAQKMVPEAAGIGAQPE